MMRVLGLLLLVGACAPAAVQDGVQIGTPLETSRVPALLQQGRVHDSQAVTAVDVSADGRHVAVSTLAHRHEPNFWLLSADGKPEWGRTVLPWAPFQAVVLPEAKAFGVGLAYSRVTGPLPTISLFDDAAGAETLLEDSAGEIGWLRYGAGDWRTGWTVSMVGDLVLKSGSSLFTVSGHNGAVELTSGGERRKAALPHPRPYRMASSADGKKQALAYIAADGDARSFVRAAPAVLVVRDPQNPKESWSVAPLKDAPPPAPLPDPAADFAEFAESFNMRPDSIAPFRVAVSVTVNGDGSRVALTEYGGWLWIRRKPAIGRWNPPFHVIPFVPRQKGWLRVFDGGGRELAKSELPQEGLFEVRTDRRGETIWCAPMSWFARGLSGCAWRPADEKARAVHPYDLLKSSWGSPVRFPDSVADLAVHPENGSLLVSSWDGALYRLDRAGNVSSRLELGTTARLAWSADGKAAIAGTESGEVLRLEESGTVTWRTKLPAKDPAPITHQVRPVFEGIPIYRVGRVGPEHAYVGDIWLVKTGSGAFLVDAGGTSAVSMSLQLIRAAGADPAAISHVLQTHSHGDHCGGAYLWRTRGAKIVAPQTAAFAMSWVMPMLTDYGIWVPRPVDVPLPLKRAGDEAEFEVSGLKVRAVFVPGHSFDSVVYLMELGGKRVAFTGDMGFVRESHILHRCWGDAEKAKVVARVVREKVLPFKPDVVLTGHDEQKDGTGFLEDLVRRTEEAIEKAGAPK